jgi:hypothetical protein
MTQRILSSIYHSVMCIQALANLSFVSADVIYVFCLPFIGPLWSGIRFVNYFRKLDLDSHCPPGGRPSFSGKPCTRLKAFLNHSTNTYFDRSEGGTAWTSSLACRLGFTGPQCCICTIGCACALIYRDRDEAKPCEELGAIGDFLVPRDAAPSCCRVGISKSSVPATGR